MSSALLKNSSLTMAAALASLLGPRSALHAAPSTVDDRIALSAQGSSLTNTGGGGGASAAWLHNFDADTLLGVAAEYQALSVSHWAFASLSGAMTRGTGDRRYTFYGEAHEGAGRDGPHAFKYRIEALGVTGTYFHRLSATVEDKQVDVESTHGNLPKLQLAYLWNPRIQTTVAYQHSFGGNLGTITTNHGIKSAIDGSGNYQAPPDQQRQHGRHPGEEVQRNGQELIPCSWSDLGELLYQQARSRNATGGAPDRIRR